jgi:hypothetical protein
VTTPPLMGPLKRTGPCAGTGGATVPYRLSGCILGDKAGRQPQREQQEMQRGAWVRDAPVVHRHSERVSPLLLVRLRLRSEVARAAAPHATADRANGGRGRDDHGAGARPVAQPRPTDGAAAQQRRTARTAAAAATTDDAASGGDGAAKSKTAAGTSDGCWSAFTPAIAVVVAGVVLVRGSRRRAAVLRCHARQRCCMSHRRRRSPTASGAAAALQSTRTAQTASLRVAVGRSREANGDPNDEAQSWERAEVAESALQFDRRQTTATLVKVKQY